ncbi:MAG: MFS transporter [Alphaproteobacteria bacterium]|nr:MFS transporter [Alphaproteobacteria bacterium]
MPWVRFHWLVAFGLGATWILDGLEVTLVGSLSGALEKSSGLGLNAALIGYAASFYIAGAVLGALLFGWLTDLWGRKRLFTVTLGVYLIATVLTGLSFNFWSFVLFRFLTGMGIGGEYAAINSAVQEFIPARRRGVTDLVINGSYWIGAALGALGAVAALNPAWLPPTLGWRVAFVTGGVLAIFILLVRKVLPESPRWLMTHGRVAEAEHIVGRIEAAARRQTLVPQAADLPRIRLGLPQRLSLVDVGRILFVQYPARVVLCLTLMATQAFCYNAIFFTYGLILTHFYRITARSIGWYILPFALGNFAGPLLLGHFFDSIGRKPLIAATYAISGVLVIVVGILFAQGLLDAVTQTIAWSVIFFFASAGASAAYLTVGESFPLEMRAFAIALFYAFGTAIGGIAGPALFGVLIADGARSDILNGYLLGGVLMLLAALVELRLGIAAERRPLEEISAPLSEVTR